MTAFFDTGCFLGQNIYSQISHFCSPDVREFFSLDNPKNAQTMNDQDDQPGADESDVQVIFFLLDEAVSGLS